MKNIHEDPNNHYISITILVQKEYTEITNDLTTFLLIHNMSDLKGVARRFTSAAYSNHSSNTDLSNSDSVILVKIN
jgi:hypothetical protein